MVHGSDVVITICQELQDTVGHMGVGERALLIENVMGGDVEDAPSLTPDEIRRRWDIPATAPIALYTGTFEAYQGVESADSGGRAPRPHASARRACWSSAASRAQVDAARAVGRQRWSGGRRESSPDNNRRARSRLSCRRATSSCRRAFAEPTRR